MLVSLTTVMKIERIIWPDKEKNVQVWPEK